MSLDWFVEMLVNWSIWNVNYLNRFDSIDDHRKITFSGRGPVESSHLSCLFRWWHLHYASQCRWNFTFQSALRMIAKHCSQAPTTKAKHIPRPGFTWFRSTANTPRSFDTKCISVIKLTCCFKNKMKHFQNFIKFFILFASFSFTNSQHQHRFGATTCARARQCACFAL